MLGFQFESDKPKAGRIAELVTSSLVCAHAPIAIHADNASDAGEENPATGGVGSGSACPFLGSLLSLQDECLKLMQLQQTAM